jgi:hypothetical protein
MLLGEPPRRKLVMVPRLVVMSRVLISFAVVTSDPFASSPKEQHLPSPPQCRDDSLVISDLLLPPNGLSEKYLSQRFLVFLDITQHA